MDKDILVCIFNYRNDENARRWLDLLSPHFDARVLDSGNDKKVKDFVQFPNIFYSGLFNEMKKIADCGQYSWVGLICSDVTIEDDVVDSFIEKLKWLKTTQNVGQYQPSFDATSYKWRGNNTNKKYTLEGKHLLDGPIIFMKNDILKKYPYIDTNVNLYGCSIGRCFSVFCERNGYINVFDNTVCVHHPLGTGYEKEKSTKQGNDYIEYFKIFYGMTNDELEKGRSNNSIGDVSSLIKTTKDNAPETKKKRKKKVVYTCITGNYDHLLDLTKVSDGFDYICFSDTVEYTGSLWNIRPIPEELKELSNVKQQRIIKICPHKYLQEYDLSVWIDGNIDILVDLDLFISTYCSDESKSVFIPSHPHRDCIYKEGLACVKCKKEAKEIVEPLLERYKKEGFPDNYGLVQSGVIIRRHNDPYCVTLMDLWGEELISNSHRDQLSFNYCLWLTGDQGFVYLPSKTFSIRCFSVLRHNKKRIKMPSTINKSIPLTSILPTNKEGVKVMRGVDSYLVMSNVKTFILDNGYSLNATKYKEVFKEFGDVEIVKCDDHRFSNGYKRIIEAVNSGEYRYIISVRSNVNLFGVSRIGDEIIRKLKSITRGYKNVGIYTPSFNYASGAGNPSVRKQREGERCVDLIGDGFFILDTSYVNSLPVYDFSRCPSGHGFVEILCDKVIKNGGKIIVDDSLYVSSSYIRTFNIDTLEQHRKALFRYNADIDK